MFTRRKNKRFTIKERDIRMSLQEELRSFRLSWKGRKFLHAAYPFKNYV